MAEFKPLKETMMIQEEGCKQIAENNLRLIVLAFNTGVGKTYASIAIAAKLRPSALLTVIGPPAKIGDGSWEASVASYNRVMGTDLKVQLMTFAKMSNEKHQMKLNKRIAEHRDDGNILIIDEIQYIRSVTGKHAEANITFAKQDTIDYVIGASATPSPNNPFDSIAYFILNGLVKNKTQFNNRLAVRYDDYYKPIYKNDNDLKDPGWYYTSMDKMIMYVDSEHLLPPYEDHYHTGVELYTGSKYIEPLFNSEKYPFGDMTPRTSAGHYHRAMLYYKYGFFKNMSEYRSALFSIIGKDPNRKLYLCNLLKQHFSDPESKPVIVTHQLNLEKAAIEDVCDYLNLNKQYINGDHKELDKPEDSRTVIILQYQAGGPAIELPFAPTTIFYGATYSYDNLKQVRGRNRRRFGEDTIHYHYISTPNRMDAQAWFKVFNKENFSYNLLKKSTNEALKDIV